MSSGNEKTQRDVPIESPIAFRPCSNGEYCPPPETERDRLAEARYREIASVASKRLGMTRREFTRSAGGTVAALAVINQVYGCGDNEPFCAPCSAIEDNDEACALLAGDEFIFDVQVHAPSPLSPWRDDPLPSSAEDFIRTVFVGSDTTVGCLSGIPGARDGGVGNAEARAQIQEIIDKLGGPRLRYHVNVDPKRGPSELDYMQETAENFEVGAWKVYPHVGPWRLDDAENGMPFVTRACELGVRVIAAHRGIAPDAGGYGDPSSPIDVARAARVFPDVAFLTYHSAWQDNVREDHPFDPDNAAPSGVDRLIKAVRDQGIGRDGNVYAELGSTWRYLMTRPDEAAHVLGKLLVHLGEDRIIWGTDSVFTGSPQEQIAAFRTFQIPQSMQEQYGYPAITDAIRGKIFGLNAAAVYGVDPEAMRCEIRDDFIQRLRLARKDDPRSVPIPDEKRYGPRNRREFVAFLRWERLLGHG